MTHVLPTTSPNPNERYQRHQRNSQVSVQQMQQIQFGVEKGVESTAPRVCMRQVLDRH